MSQQAERAVSWPRRRILDKPKEVTYFSHPLPYPKALMVKKVDPVPAALYALKLGMLADRGRVSQRVGDVSFPLRVADIPPFIPSGKPEEAVVSILRLTSDTVRVIASETRLRPRSELEIGDWFLRAVEMYSRFDDDKTRLGLETPSGNFLATHDGLDYAWEVSGLPEMEVTDLNPGRVFTPFARIHIPYFPEGITRGRA